MISKRTVSLLLVLCILFMTAACASSVGDDEESTAAAETTEAVTEDPRMAISDDLPDTDLGGYAFRICHGTEDNMKYVYVAEDDGEVVNTASYKAQLAVCDRFNCTIEPIVTGLGDVEHMAFIKKSVAAGDDFADIVFGHDVLTPVASLEGIFYNLYDVPNINFEKPWWAQNAVADFTVLGQCYIGISSISYMSIARSRVIVVNEDLAEDYGVTIPYADVLDGTWTLDKLIALTRDFYTDANGDQTSDSGDIYGYVTEGGMYGYLENFAMYTAGRDENGEIVNGVDANMDKMTSIVNKVYDWLVNGSGTYICGDANAYGTEEFKANQLLMGHFELNTVISDFRFTDIHYGLLVMPKWDEAQQNYVTSCVEHPLVIPVTVPSERLSTVGLLTEAMSAMGYKLTVPAFYETALQVKYLDNESVKVMDIIYNSRSMSLSFVYVPDQAVNLSLYFMMGNSSPTSDFASYYAKHEKSFNQSLDKVNKFFVEHEPA
jgi:hypothetical protein